MISFWGLDERESVSRIAFIRRYSSESNPTCSFSIANLVSIWFSFIMRALAIRFAQHEAGSQRNWKNFQLKFSLFNWQKPKIQKPKIGIKMARRGHSNVLDGLDWEKYSSYSCKLSALSCIVTSIVTLSTASSKNKIWVGVWVLVSAMISIFLDFPEVDICIPNSMYLRKVVSKQLFYENLRTKGLFYGCLSIACFWYHTWCFISGILLIISSLLLIIAGYYKPRDVDELYFEEDAALDDDPSLSFGTFWSEKSLCLLYNLWRINAVYWNCCRTCILVSFIDLD